MIYKALQEKKGIKHKVKKIVIMKKWKDKEGNK